MFVKKVHVLWHEFLCYLRYCDQSLTVLEQRLASTALHFTALYPTPPSPICFPLYVLVVQPTDTIVYTEFVCRGCIKSILKETDWWKPTFLSSIYIRQRLAGRKCWLAFNSPVCLFFVLCYKEFSIYQSTFQKRILLNLCSIAIVFRSVNQFFICITFPIIKHTYKLQICYLRVVIQRTWL